MKATTTCLAGLWALLGLLVISVSTADAQDRWNRTATDGSGLELGDPTTLTWGLVDDGLSISGFNGEPTSDSDLISFLDTQIGSGGGGSDLTNRPWFGLFEGMYDRWSSVSGLTFQYEPNDDGATFASASGVLGVRADMRVGGHFIDGGGGVLAYNFYPDTGEMVIDTGDGGFYSNSNENYLRLRNVLAHEVGHGLGLPHVESNNSRQLMEPFINTSFDGPQIDDIYQVQRRYGDAWEKFGGNDTRGTAFDLGTLTSAGISIGGGVERTIANGGEVMPDEIDFVSIDDDGDEDFWSFTVDEEFDITMELDMVGLTYNRGPQGGSQSPLSLAEQSDLDLQLLDSDGNVLASSSLTGLDVTESLFATISAGTYFAQVVGRDNSAQFYHLRLSGQLTSVPEPAAAGAIGVVLAGLMLRRRRS